MADPFDDIVRLANGCIEHADRFLCCGRGAACHLRRQVIAVHYVRNGAAKMANFQRNDVVEPVEGGPRMTVERVSETTEGP